MRLSHAFRRWAARGGTATVAAIGLAGGMQAAGGAQASAAGSPATANPYSPAYHHPYRQGVIPTRPQLAKMRTWARTASCGPAS
jgi:serine protease